jgi:hypothetical protein
MDTRAVLCACLVVICGCARASTVHPPQVVTSAEVPASRPAPAREAEAERPAQRPGDYVIYRFSGAFRKAPLTLTQKILEPSRLELTFDDGKTKRIVRARFDTAPSQLVDAVRVVDDEEQTITRAQLDAMMAETVLAAFATEEALGTEAVTVEVAGRALKCDKSSYRILVGRKKAVMSSFKSDAFTWGDVGAEIKTDDGKVLYRAEVVDVGPHLPFVARLP